MALGWARFVTILFLTLLPLDALQVDVGGGLDTKERFFVKDKPCVALVLPWVTGIAPGWACGSVALPECGPRSSAQSLLGVWTWDGSPA